MFYHPSLKKSVKYRELLHKTLKPIQTTCSSPIKDEGKVRRTKERERSSRRKSSFSNLPFSWHIIVLHKRFSIVNICNCINDLRRCSILKNISKSVIYSESEYSKKSKEFSVYFILLEKTKTTPSTLDVILWKL